MAFPSTIQFQGRWILEGDKRYATWCGSSLHFRTSSRSICLEFGDLTAASTRMPYISHPNLLWSFGSGSQVETHTTRVTRLQKLIMVPDGDTGASNDEIIRDVTVMLCDWGGALHVSNISTTDGQSILAPRSESPIRPMLFIGASLVSGFSPPWRKIVLPQGTNQTFASVMVRRLCDRGLDARLEMVAYPGVSSSAYWVIGDNSTGLRLTSTPYEKGMEDIFWEGLNGDDGWDTRSKDLPEDIFICIGSNDKAWGEDVDVFLEHYKTFLVRLRDNYHASCKRIYVISPFGSFNSVVHSERRTAYEPDVQHMVEALAESWSSSDPGGPKVYHVSTEGWIDYSLTCDALHPTVDGHKRISEKLVDLLDSRGVL